MAAIYHLDKNFYDPENAEAIAKPLAVYCCPSGPGQRMMTVADSSGAIAGAPLRAAAGDYFAPNSIKASWISDPTLRTATSQTTETAMADNCNRLLSEIKDGTAYTLLVSEQAGRPNWYIKGVQQSTTPGANANSATIAVGGTTYSQSNPAWWGCWASYQVHAYWTYTDDGLTENGPRTINGNNSQGVYSFHVGGAPAVFCDGAVHFLSESMSPQVLGAIVTRRSGELLSGKEFD
jgi:hypothetical protein